MRIAILFFLLLPYFSFAQLNQTDSNGLRQGPWQKQQANGRLLYEGSFKDGKPVGEWKRYHNEGQLKAKILYQPDSDSAFAQLFDVWGKKVAEGKYFNEKKTERWSYFSENRKVADEEFHNGMKHGLSRKFYETGEIQESIQWQNGQQQGNYEVFFKSGKPFVQCKMSNNQRNGLYLTYFENGRMELEANYASGLRQGDWKYFDNEGRLLYTLKYDHGKILNPEVRDSIATLQLQNLERGKDGITDPEKYIEDPSEYMQKMNIYK